MPTSKTARKSPAKPSRKRPARRPARAAPAPPPPPAPEPVVAQLPPPSPREAIVVTSPEVVFATRVPTGEPVRPLPPLRRAIFFDVENSSRPEHITVVLDHLAIDWTTRATELFAVGNWRVIGHESARLLASRGGHLVHSAPSAGVRDWSDLRIAVAAGAWLAAARPGDTVEIISDDQAFDAVGDVAASLGVAFHRLSFRALAGLGGGTASVEVRTASSEPRSRGRRRRGGRRDGGRDSQRHGGTRGGREGQRQQRAEPRPAPTHRAPVPIARAEVAPAVEPHTAPVDEIVHTMQDLLRTSPDGVKLDTLANALKERGFRRPPGSPRLITRLRHLKSLEVTSSGIVRLAASARVEPVAEPSTPDQEPLEDDAESAAEASGNQAVPEPGQHRRRRRRGRRRRGGRGRGGNGPPSAASDADREDEPVSSEP